MGLAEKIQKDLVDAMRAKDELRLSVLRGIKAAIKHKEVAQQLSGEDEIRGGRGDARKQRPR